MMQMEVLNISASFFLAKKSPIGVIGEVNHQESYVMELRKAWR